MSGRAVLDARLLAVAIAVLLLPGCRHPKEGAPGGGRAPIVAPDTALLPITPPPVEDLDRVARDQTRRREEHLEGLLANRGASKPDLAAAYGDLGKAYHAFGLHRFAIPCYENASRLDPAVFAWPYLLARAHWQLGQAEAAGTALGKALGLDPRSLPALIFLAEIHGKGQRTEEARAAYRRALEVSPGCAPALYGLGQIDFLTGDAEGAIRHLEDVLAAQPQASRIHYLLALSYRRVGNAEKARFHMERRGDAMPVPVPDPLMEAVLDLNPQVIARRGVAALRAGAFGRAVELLGAAREARPEDGDLRIQLGVALASTGNPEAALVEYREALRMRPDDPRALYFTGAALSALGRDQEAVASMGRAIELHPEYAEAQLGLSQALQRLGRYAEALRSGEQAVRLDPSSVAARAHRARLLARLGRCRDAVEAGEAGLRAVPQDQSLTVLLARLLSTCPDGAVRSGGRALTLAKQAFAANATVERAATVALAHAARGDWKEAVTWQRRALALLPEGRAPAARAALTQRLAAYRERRLPPVEW